MGRPLRVIRRQAWTARRARIACRALKPVVEQNGWALTMRGSLLTADRGNDLDLIAIPVWGNALSAETLSWLIYCELGWEVLERRHDLLHGSTGVLYEIEHRGGHGLGRIVDMNFWRSPSAPPARSLAELQLEDEIAGGWGDGC